MCTRPQQVNKVMASAPQWRPCLTAVLTCIVSVAAAICIILRKEKAAMCAATHDSSEVLVNPSMPLVQVQSAVRHDGQPLLQLAQPTQLELKKVPGWTVCCARLVL